jgi:hypothetical protein
MFRILVASAVVLTSGAFAAEPVKKPQAGSVKTITRVFDELVLFSLPKGFKPVFENATGNRYIWEAVLAGENVNKWTQMVTMTGAKGLAANPEITPQNFAGKMAGGFQAACPASFSAKGLGPVKIGTHDAFAAIMSCGTASQAGTPYSETMMLLVIKGDADYYSIQWAERGAASKTPLNIDAAKWSNRFTSLGPIRLCPVVPGEKAPYPSCLN